MLAALKQSAAISQTKLRALTITTKHYHNQYHTTIDPGSVNILDIAPYNTFTLMCTATVPSNVTGAKSFEWRKSDSSSDAYEMLVPNEDITIINLNVENTTSASILVARQNVSGSFSYVCTATVAAGIGRATSTIVATGTCITLQI